LEVSNVRPRVRAGYDSGLCHRARRERTSGVRGIVSPQDRGTGVVSPEDKSRGQQVGVKPARLPDGGLRV
jgi:hypothetical protein